MHIAFHYHLTIVLILLKYCCKGRKIASHPPISADTFEGFEDNFEETSEYCPGKVLNCSSSVTCSVTIATVKE